MGMSKYVARFTKFDARLVLDPANPAASSVTATIDPRSVETDYPVGKRDFNKELAEQPTWFNAARFPKIEFVSKSVRIVGKNRAQVLGDLTLLGVKKPVRLDVVLNRAINPHPLTKVPAVGFSAKGKLLRSDFGMAHLIPLGVGDEVEIEIEAEFSQTSAG
jgi:polyisoprenoid-binding protein YceI